MSETSLTGLEKAAVLLKSLPRAVVDKVLRHMDPRQASRVLKELDEVGKRADLDALLARILDEAAEALMTGKSDVEPSKPAPEATKSAGAPARNASAPSAVDVRIGDGESSTAADAKSADPLAPLAAVSPEVLALALETESAKTITLFMNRMEIEVAGRIYKRLSPAKRKEVSLRFTEQTAVPDVVLRRMATALLDKCGKVGAPLPAGTSEQEEREKRMAGLLRNLERADRIEMLAALEEADPDLVTRLKNMLYQFEDILRMEKTSVQKMLSEVDMPTLSLALRGAPAEINDRIISNLSRRAQESLKEEMDLVTNVPIAKVREARKAIEEAIMRLDQRDELVMIEEG